MVYSIDHHFYSLITFTIHDLYLILDDIEVMAQAAMAKFATN